MRRDGRTTRSITPSPCAPYLISITVGSMLPEYMPCPMKLIAKVGSEPPYTVMSVSSFDATTQIPAGDQRRLGLLDCEALVRFYVGHLLTDAAGPFNFDGWDGSIAA